MLVILEKDRSIVEGMIESGGLKYYAFSVARLSYGSSTSRFHYKYRKRQILTLPPHFDDNEENRKLCEKLVDAIYEEEFHLIELLRDYLDKGSLRKLAKEVDISYTSLHVMFKEFKARVISRLKEWGEIE